ncbi:putative guanine nucleotide exchange factor [Heterostelium album PN500]|uniref:Putative guanine nucleotide exchange factor n=1 Tax=Heterostelium pallidum (strain ATCC 26659 / Pp 5 / PN500) TaxID=670386 RepID=D3B655_HETP5|nr:putative guanine nucleotide exchange factor [Heterostelium album PN500]EFA83353.1 putative guanine nucleotide exchange factor [Heterostelium album PN500]|eukprot:XP_020435470.1 putative guanine nucleotide exchange factor [Heterostelium album PN500]
MSSSSSRKLLFDQFLLVTLKEEEIDKTLNTYQPSSMSSTKQQQQQSESFSFVLTDREGNQQFGFTRRILTKSMINNRVLLVPESLCIISRYAWFSTFTKMLEILETRYHVSVEEIHTFLAAALLSVIPAPGDNFTVHIYNNPFLQQPQKSVELPTSYILTRPLDIGKSSLHDGTLFPLIESLSSQKILKNICKVSKFVNAAVALLDPFVWQHIFIPVLPRSLLDYCTAPMPFIIGVHSSLFPLIRKKPLNEIIFVDLDKDQVLPLPEDIALFPTQLNQLLKQCLDSQILEWKKNKNYNNKIIVDTFRKFFVQILGTYRRFFLKDMDRKKMIFDKISFIDSQLITPTKNLTPPGIFEKEVVLFDLRNPVTQSINNTLKSKEKEKEKEREKERIEKEKAIAKANAYRQVLEVKKPALNPKLQSNGSVDRSILSSLRIGGNNNNSSSTVMNTNSSNNNNSNDIKSHTVTIASLSSGNLGSSSNTNTSNNNNVELPKPKSSVNLSSLTSLTSGLRVGGNSNNNPASIGRSTSTSFTMGSTSTMPHPTAPSHSVSNPSLTVSPSPNQSSLSVTNTSSTGSSGHSRSISVSDVGHMLITQVAKTVTATTSTVSNISHTIVSHTPIHNLNSHQKLSTTPPPPSSAQPLGNNNNSSNNNSPATAQLVEQQYEFVNHPNSGHRKNIQFRSIPFVLIHQKFSPQDITHLCIEDINNFLFPPNLKPQQQQQTTNIPNIIETPSSPPPELANTANNTNTNTNNDSNGSQMKRTSSIDRNLFKIPELPEHFAIPLTIRRPRTSSTNVASTNASSMVPTPIPNNNIVQVPPMINPNYSVSQKLSLPPPPSSPHTMIRKSHHRSSSVSSSTPSTSLTKTSIPTRLTTSQQHQQNSITLTPPFHIPPPPVPSSSLLKLQTISSSSPPSSKDSSPEINSDITSNSLKMSASVPKSSLAYDTTQAPSNNSSYSQSTAAAAANNEQQQQQNPSNSQNQTPITAAASYDNPLPPLSNNSVPSTSNFFDTNPLSTPIETSIPISASTNNFFSECSPLGVPSSTPVVGSSGMPIPPNPIAQSTSDAFSQFVSPAAQSSNCAFGSVSNSSSISSTTSSSILPPLLNSSGMIPPPSTSSFCTNFFDQSPLSHSSNFNDFGPPASSFGSYNHVANNSNPNTHTNTPALSGTGMGNPLPPLIQPTTQTSSTNPIAASGSLPKPISSNDGMDEFDLFLSMRNKKI